MKFFRKISGFLEKRCQYKTAVGQLSRMTDRELSDIGISRADIHEVVRKDIARKTNV